MEKTERTVGVYLWQKMTMLDVLGPHQFLAYVPGLKVVTFAKTTDPVVTDTGVRLIPDHDFSTCPPLDILLVGGGVNPLPEMQDDDVLSFLRQAGDGAEYVTSVCTGSLILAEAGHAVCRVRAREPGRAEVLRRVRCPPRGFLPQLRHDQPSRQ